MLVATSNVAPENLYRDGLNRQLFLPFIGLLERNAEVLTLDAEKDYRQEKLNRLRPITVGQASRVSGITPADIAILMFYLKPSSS